MWKERLNCITLTLALASNSVYSPVVLAKEAKAEPIPMEDVQRFSNAISQIKKYYVKPIDDKELFNNAIRGMLVGLDPHSAFLDEDEFNDLQTSTSGEFGGLGIEVTMEEGVIKVVSPIVDAPAYKAGIRSGDYIIKLGNQSVQGISLKQAVDLMRGKVGSPIELTVLRKGVDKPLKFSIIREKIQIKSVKSKLIDNKYGYIRITQFQALTAEDMEKAVNQLKQQAGGKLSGFILDLRNNPGGLLDSAIQVSDAFIDNDKTGPEEMIVYTKGRLEGSKFTAYANPGDILDKAPMVVLINGGSASASEIVAGALKDNKRALIVGTRSFGKGSVQSVLPLDEKSGMKLTTALYYTPAGISIQATGINPDIVIDEMTIPKSKDDKASLNFSEADLSGHILNADKNETPVSDKSVISDDGPLLYEDYQLYSALTVLKGLALVKK